MHISKNYLEGKEKYGFYADITLRAWKEKLLNEILTEDINDV